jgi:hypothetical protein
LAYLHVSLRAINFALLSQQRTNLGQDFDAIRMDTSLFVGAYIEQEIGIPRVGGLELLDDIGCILGRTAGIKPLAFQTPASLANCLIVEVPIAEMSGFRHDNVKIG